MVLPVGHVFTQVDKTLGGKIITKELMDVLFVPLTDKSYYVNELTLILMNQNLNWLVFISLVMIKCKTNSNNIIISFAKISILVSFAYLIDLKYIYIQR